MLRTATLLRRVWSNRNLPRIEYLSLNLETQLPQNTTIRIEPEWREDGEKSLRIPLPCPQLRSYFTPSLNAHRRNANLPAFAL